MIKCKNCGKKLKEEVMLSDNGNKCVFCDVTQSQRREIYESFERAEESLKRIDRQLKHNAKHLGTSEYGSAPSSGCLVVVVSVLSIVAVLLLV